MAQPTTGRIEACSSGSEVRLRVSGRATHIISQPLREYAWQMIRRGYRDFFIELTDCLYLDSTFAGVLAGTAMKLREAGGKLTLVCLPPRCAELLVTLGIEPLFNYSAAPLSDPQPGSELQALPMAARSREAWAGTILEAHRLLAEAERANETRFEDVLEFLKSEMPGSTAGKFKN